MPKGKPWSRQDEKRLRKMVEAGASLQDLTKAFNRKKDAIRKKLSRLGLKVVVHTKSRKPRTTTSEIVPKGLLTHEKVLRVLAGAIEKAKEQGLDKFEIMRLKVLVDAAKTYDSVLEKWERWIEFESRLSEMDGKIGELEKELKTAKGNA